MKVFTQLLPVMYSHMFNKNMVAKKSAKKAVKKKVVAKKKR